MAKIRVSISGKKVEITEALRSYVDKKISKLDKYLDDNRTASAEVMLRIERGIHIAEVTVNLSGVLRVWVPWLAFLTVVGVNLAYFSAADVPGWWAVLLVLIAVAAALWMANALTITSLFVFRTVDIARLATYFLLKRPGVTLGNAGVLVAAAAVTYAASEAVLALAGSLLAMMLLLTCRPMITEVREEFVA